jgi:hypothetical protein
MVPPSTPSQANYWNILSAASPLNNASPSGTDKASHAADKYASPSPHSPLFA